MTAPLVRTTCANCDAPLQGHYCHGCGQPADDHLGSLRAFVSHVVEQLFQLDSRLLRSLLTLLFRPGVLAAEYLAGRRARWVGPFQAYAVAAALLFLAASVHPIVRFSAARRTYYSGLPSVGLGNRLTDAEVARLAARGISLELYGERFVASTMGQLSAFLVFSVPAFALVVWLLHARRRRPLPHHVVFALYWSAFALLCIAAAQALPQRGLAWRIVDGVLLYLVAIVYLVLAVRRVYGGRWWSAVLRGVALFLVYQFILLEWLSIVVARARREL